MHHQSPYAFNIALTGNLLKASTNTFSKLEHIHVSALNFMLRLVTNETENATRQFQLGNYL